MHPLIASVLSCVLVAGCSGTGATENSPGGPSVPQTVTLIEKGLVFFDSGSTRLNSKATEMLDASKPASWFEGVDQVSIIGHTDRSGSQADNLKLSLHRAEVVRDALIARGAPKALFVVVHGVGEEHPMIPTADGVAEPQNNFVEIISQ